MRFVRRHRTLLKRAGNSRLSRHFFLLSFPVWVWFNCWNLVMKNVAVLSRVHMHLHMCLWVCFFTPAWWQAEQWWQQQQASGSGR